MSRSTSNQHLGSLGGAVVDHGEVSFAARGLTVSIYTNLSSILSGIVAPLNPDGNAVEMLSLGKTVSGGVVTLTRQTQPFCIQAGADDAIHANGSTYEWELFYLGAAPCNATIQRVTLYNKTKAGGSPIVNLGTDRCYKTGLTFTHATATLTGTAGDFSALAAGDTIYVSGTDITAGFCTVATVDATGTNITVTGLTTTGGGTESDAVVNTRTSLISDAEAKAMPASGAKLTITAAGDFVGNALPTVRTGDMLVFGTTGGTTSAPSGLLAQVDLLPLPTSALRCHYQLNGLG